MHIPDNNNNIQQDLTKLNIYMFIVLSSLVRSCCILLSSTTFRGLAGNFIGDLASTIFTHGLWYHERLYH